MISHFNILIFFKIDFFLFKLFTLLEKISNMSCNLIEIPSVIFEDIKKSIDRGFFIENYCINIYTNDYFRVEKDYVNADRGNNRLIMVEGDSQNIQNFINYISCYHNEYLKQN